jgi:hypothetical protein
MYTAYPRYGSSHVSPLGDARVRSVATNMASTIKLLQGVQKEKDEKTEQALYILLQAKPGRYASGATSNPMCQMRCVMLDICLHRYANLVQPAAL